MAPYPAPAGRRMRNLLLHPDNFGKIRLSAGTGRPPIRQGKEESCQTGKESRTARRKGGNPSGTEKRRARLPVRRRGTAEKTPPPISSGERNGNAPDILKNESAASPAQTAGESDVPAHDAADGKQPEPENSANRKEAQAAQSAVTPVLETRLRGKASRQTTNMGDVNSYVRKFAKPMTLNQWKSNTPTCTQAGSAIPRK